MESTAGERCIRIDTCVGEVEDILDQVQQRLSESCHFSRHWREISCDFGDGILTLRGRLPSFYLKQVLQSILMGMPGIQRIDNRVDVVSSAGLSSVRL